VPDCATCHVPASTPPSLAPLLPTRAVRLSVQHVGSATDEESLGWLWELGARLTDEGLTVVSEAPGANSVAIDVRRTEEPGATDRGVRFQTTRYAAVITLGSATIEVRGRPGIAAELTQARAAAREDLIERIVTALTLAF